MSTLLLTNIGELTTNVAGGGVSAVRGGATRDARGDATRGTADGDPCGTLRDAAVLVREGRVAWVGSMDAAPGGNVRAGDAPTDHASMRDAPVVVDAGGRAVLPGFVDSHTHLVFAGDRAAEFEARMAGERYAAGGIRTTVAATRAASDEELRAGVAALVAECRGQGTTTLEVKTGYGLDVESETRLARLAAEVTEEVTFLGAHVVPPAFAGRADAYVDMVAGEMLAAVAPFSRWIDVFCEDGAFTADQGRRVLEAGRAAGLGIRVHGNQLGYGEGVALAVELGAAAVDHCTYLSDDDVRSLAGSETVATLLPGVEFSTRQPYPDARRLLDAGVTVALASDCNPGSSFTSSMPLVIALAVREMGMTTAEAVWAATAGGARALRRTDIGVVAAGARADLVLLDAPTRAHLAYRPGVPLVDRVWKDGVEVGVATGA
ncbi:imidazolonepropionase [Microbacterium sp.]|uniref:imidazolonepropionase n=1 Tax=Microbacterium sp. TaxID=51671 RepID=UPI00391A8642